jgi:sugar phosphate isomerase/epimerase
VVAEHIKGFLPYLEKYDMILVLEVHGDHGTGMILKEIANLVGSNRVLVNYDTANAIFYGDVDVVKDFGDCLDKVGYVHLKEKAAGRQEWDFPALGKGYVPFPEVFDLLEKAGNASPFSIEIEFTAAGPKDLAEINQAVADSAAYLKAQGFNF